MVDDDLINQLFMAEVVLRGYDCSSGRNCCSRNGSSMGDKNNCLEERTASSFPSSTDHYSKQGQGYYRQKQGESFAPFDVFYEAVIMPIARCCRELTALYQRKIGEKRRIKQK